MNDKDKRRGQRKQKKLTKKKTSRRTRPAAAPSAATPFAMEQMMKSMFGGGAGPASDPKSVAQDLAYEAMEAPTPEQALQLATRALQLHPRCVDALLIVARTLSRDDAELLEALADIVRAGQEDLGQDFFADNQGHFWGILETRPYMRARASLASHLARAGRVDEAIEHLEGMLALNPNDNQGLRYVLLGHYLEVGRLDGPPRLFEAYEGEGSAMFTWGRVLHAFLTGGDAAARQALTDARAANPFAENYLSGRKRMPKKLPGFYGIGDENEGIVCAVELGAAWTKHPDAVAWLKSAH
jgi:tetratricopeptide (TPR) repeat protein